MARKRVISFAESAVIDLEAIRAWYLQREAPDVGERLLYEVMDAIERLAHFPESGRVVPEFAVPQLREIIHPPFRIVYRVDKHQVRIVNVAHAGDGNVHPILLFDERDKEEVARVLAAGEDLLEECIHCGGSVTAEHGIGVEKLAFMSRLFGESDLAAMARVRNAFCPAGRLNPGKLLPDSNGTSAARVSASRRALP